MNSTFTASVKISGTVHNGKTKQTYAVELPEPKTSFLVTSTEQSAIGRNVDITKLGSLLVQNLSISEGENVLISKRGIPFALLEPGQFTFLAVIRPAEGSVASVDYYVATSVAGTPTLGIAAYMLA